MTLLKAIILGVVQGLTEFLPISSSGHLVIFSHFLGLDRLPQNFRVSFDVILHLGTLVAVIFFFRSEVVEIIRSSFTGRSERSRKNRRLLLLLLLATIPAALLGKLFGDTFESIFSSPWKVGILLIVTGSMLFLGEAFSKPQKEIDEISFKGALAVGFAQALAIAPGISRSGSTIVAGMLTGTKRSDAARFSFLLSIPIIAGAAFTKINFIFKISSEAAIPVSMGFVFSVLSGYFAIQFLIGYLERNRLYPFAYYCWAAGIIAILLTFTI